MFFHKNSRLIRLFLMDNHNGMKKIKATKLKMTQIWKGNAMVAVSPLRLADPADADEVKEGDLVKVTGFIKGHGFQGPVKRYSFAGGPKTHGQKNRYRAPGSIGSTAPQRVLPGRKMAGHMGTNKKTILNMSVADVQKEKGLVLLKGSVPGKTSAKVSFTKLS
ncbi:MAG: 50S ribosomal protein L3 [Patescibacteria group bacterium]|nr:50S ribosomal protein L3 [Patescibacteria group bacterium]